MTENEGAIYFAYKTLHCNWPQTKPLLLMDLSHHVGSELQSFEKEKSNHKARLYSSSVPQQHCELPCIPSHYPDNMNSLSPNDDVGDMFWSSLIIDDSLVGQLK
jgi:hypothetical protein